MSKSSSRGRKSFLANAQAAVSPVKVHFSLKTLRKTADVGEHLHTQTSVSFLFLEIFAGRVIKAVQPKRLAVFFF